MSPPIILAVAGVAAYAGYKLFGKLLEQAATPDKSDQEDVRRKKAAYEARKAASQTRNLGALEWDEKAGVYRPRPGDHG